MGVPRPDSIGVSVRSYNRRTESDGARSV